MTRSTGRFSRYARTASPVSSLPAASVTTRKADKPHSPRSSLTFETVSSHSSPRPPDESPDNSMSVLHPVPVGENIRTGDEASAGNDGRRPMTTSATIRSQAWVTSPERGITSANLFRARSRHMETACRPATPAHPSWRHSTNRSL
jgi:hypothetical protein